MTWCTCIACSTCIRLWVMSTQTFPVHPADVIPCTYIQVRRFNCQIVLNVLISAVISWTTGEIGSRWSRLLIIREVKVGGSLGLGSVVVGDGGLVVHHPPPRVGGEAGCGAWHGDGQAVARAVHGVRDLRTISKVFSLRIWADFSKGNISVCCLVGGTNLIVYFICFGHCDDWVRGAHGGERWMPSIVNSAPGTEYIENGINNS